MKATTFPKTLNDIFEMARNYTNFKQNFDNFGQDELTDQDSETERPNNYQNFNQRKNQNFKQIRIRNFQKYNNRNYNINSEI